MINRVVLVGRITKDIELRKTQSGTSVVSFTMAVNRRVKQEGQPEADFIRCVAWSKTAELMAQYLNKGAQIGVEGRIQTGSYQDKDGKTVYTTDVVVDNVQFLESKNASNNNNNQTYTPQDNQFGGGYTQQNNQNTGFTQQQPQAAGGFNQQQGSSLQDDFANDTLDIASDDLPF